MRPARRYILLCLLLACITYAAADNPGGSTYSRYGFGDIRYFNSNRGFAMGGSGIAVLSTVSIDRINPAAWSPLDKTKFSVGALYEGYSSDDGLQTAYYGKTHFNGLILSLPVSPQNGIAATVGVTPFSRVNYNILDAQSQQGYNYTVQYLGDGGINRAHIGSSWRLGSTLHLGAKLDYYFGTISQTVTQKLSVSSLSGSEVIRTTSFHGTGVSVGTTFTGLSQLFGIPATHSFNVAAVFSSTSWLTVRDERVQTYSTGFASPSDTILTPDSKLPLPYSVAGGLSYATDRVLFALDYQFQRWSEVPVTEFNLTALRNSHRIGGGMELMAKRDPLAPFSERVAYRLGAYYLASYYVLNDQPINEWAVTAGIAFPIWGESRLNLGAQYGWRGTTEFQLQKDKILRISAAINISEFWFNRPDED